MKRTLLAPVLVLLALSAVVQGGPTEPKVGDLAPTGNLILYVLHQFKTGKPIPITLKTDYGFLVVNHKSEHTDGFIRLASRASGSVQDFDTQEKFEAALARLPRGAELTHYDKCTVPLGYEVTFNWDGFRTTCERLGIKVAEDTKITCNCPP